MLILSKRRLYVSPTVGEMKQILSRFPDDYNFSVCGDGAFYLHVDENPFDNSGSISLDNSSLDDAYGDNTKWLPLWFVEYEKPDDKLPDSTLHLVVVAAETPIDACDLVVTEYHVSYENLIRVDDHNRSINSDVPKIIADIELAR